MRINAGETVSLPIKIQLANHCELFNLYPWKVELLLRGKKIEFQVESIRMSPIYKPNVTSPKSSDVLLFTSPLFSRKEFLTWFVLFVLIIFIFFL